MGGSAADRNTDLQRADGDSSARDDQHILERAKTGLHKSSSRLNLLGPGSDLKSLGSAETFVKPSSGGLGLRRTGSKMSLADLPSKIKPTPSSAQALAPSSADVSISSAFGSDLAEHGTHRGTAAGKIPSPPISPGMPKLHRSRSMNNFENMKAPTVSEGQRAVEQISGKVELPQLEKQDHFDPDKDPVDLSKNSKEDFTRDLARDLANDLKSTQLNTSEASREGSESCPKGTKSEALDPPTANPPAPKPSVKKLPSNVSPGGLLNSPRDDGNIQPEPESRVDYFSHDWNEADIAGSWRYIISRRQDMANSARLENASWRMWAKAKNNLRTIDPATVNWLKDYDVTWLYGPLYHESDNVYNPGQQSGGESSCTSAGETKDVLPRSHFEGTRSTPPPSTPSSSTLGSASRGTASLRSSRHGPGFHPKSILKKKTLAQLMLEEINELENSQNPARRTALPSKSTANYIRHHQYRPTPQGYSRQVVADILNRQYQSRSGGLGSHSSSHSASPEGRMSPRTAVDDSYLPSSSNPMATRVAAALGSSPASSPGSSLANSRTSSRAGSQISFRTHTGSLVSLRSDSYASTDRHVHFNDRVEQCIALDPEEEVVRSDGRPDLASFRLGESAVESDHSGALDDDDEDDEDDDDDEDEDDSGGLFLGLRRPSMLDIHYEDEKPHIIAALPATTLKFQGGSDENSDRESSDDMADPGHEQVSSSRRPGFNAQYAPHSVQKFEIVDPAIRPVRFEANGLAQQNI